ncbi:hypothetical protein C8R41DRAFT_912550 [Lentinula lateritia]|uniref:RNase H type-1 domain-containing protein n=1 Tax=Lentinula lateritia TaxID=40482 RepID=A0ABQ8V059_9AGAR|nr:hypothetical protein C8R41DRAFT_912550 [Lentinula lateritia]
MTIETDSKYVLGLLKNAHELEDTGFINTSNAKLVRSTIASLRLRPTQTLLKWVKGHSGHERNEGADTMAKEAVGKVKASYINLCPPHTLHVTGAKISAMTQALAYKVIMTQKSSDADMYRRRTEINIMRVQNCVEDMFGYIPTPETFWKSIRHKDLELKLQIFLWKVTHDAYWTGTRWANLPKPELQERAICSVCEEVDDFAHILTKCQSPGQETIWQLAGQLWGKKANNIPWRTPTIGDILGCGLARIKNQQVILTGDCRLWKLLIALSAYLIWTLRCERVIANEGRPFQQIEIQNRWNKSINNQLKMDCQMAHKRYEEKALPRGLVIQTWRGVIKDEKNLPMDWIDTDGVLVGIAGGSDDGG